MNCKSLSARWRRGNARRSASSNGFTLMELLIVIAIILILMLMAIPTIGSMKKKANETSAINSMQAINKAEIQYQSTYPANGFACALSTLWAAIRPRVRRRPRAAQMLQQDLASAINLATSSPSVTAPR